MAVTERRRMGTTKFYSVSCARVEVSLELIAVEKEIQLGDLKKRFDILVYDRES
jgi:hypothetical protein